MVILCYRYYCLGHRSSRNIAAHPPPAKIPPQMLATMKMNDNVAYAASPKELRGRRNRAPLAGMREIDLETLTIDDSVEEVPRIYRKVENEYFKFGVEDFDLAFYNRTPYSGLETHSQFLYQPLAPSSSLHFSYTRAGKGSCNDKLSARTLSFAAIGVGSSFWHKNQLELIDYGREWIIVTWSNFQAFHRFFVDHLSFEGNAFPHNPVVVKPFSIPFQSDTHVHSPAAPVTRPLGIGAGNIIPLANEPPLPNSFLDCFAPR
ncbi:hypothetical protein BJ138DRAFT_1119902 [Hygrophoropsis aurantiaca]|uniref:Uncharacterized protein n=1 Tax=Hygrophoropsis aurantiaca TaxID=72124 RepID=A0ACB7ZTA8_9AGAM|nr:hypothetical protein BJ138DRAFT_1119902 [Hygrophoropsis aurantiaca]